VEKIYRGRQGYNWFGIQIIITFSMVSSIASSGLLEADENIEKYRVKKMLKSLEEAKG